MPQLLAPAVRRAELPDVQGLQGSRAHEAATFQGADLAAEFEVHLSDVGRRRILPARAVPDAAAFALREVEGASGFFERAAAEQQSTRTPRRLQPPAARGFEVQDMFSLPRRGAQFVTALNPKQMPKSLDEVNSVFCSNCHFVTCVIGGASGRTRSKAAPKKSCEALNGGRTPTHAASASRRRRPRSRSPPPYGDN